jgi:beta-glucanase (GH16 family)
VFYKGIKEYSVHNILLPVGGSIDTPHLYTLDWKSDQLSWSIDGKVLRTIRKNDSVSPMVSL